MTNYIFRFANVVNRNLNLKHKKRQLVETNHLSF